MSLSPYQKYIISIGATAVLFLTIGWNLGRNNLSITPGSGGIIPTFAIDKRNPQDVSNVNMSQFWEVWRIVTTKYIERGKITPQKLVEGATAGMVSALDDPYSAYLTPKQNEQSKEQLGGSFEGIGIQIEINKEKQIVIINPLPGTPAEKAGLKPGDIIWKIGEKDAFGISLPEAVELIKGPKGSKVKLKIQHPDAKDLTDVEVVRDTIDIKSVEVKLLENNTIAYVHVNRFGDKTQEEWDTAVAQIKKNNIKRMIFDVRDNPGGYLDTAIYINSDVMDGAVVGQEDYKGNRTFVQPNHEGRLKDIKIVGLINKGSASASEITAGGMQDRGRAKLVGELSFGKGTVQEVENISGGAGLHITTAKWLLPSGKWIHKIGLKPDYEVKPTEEELANKKDVQLDKAIEVVKAL
jgi:carboxyl-terminal processing protease